MIMRKISNFLLKKLAVLAVIVTACSFTASAYDFMVDSICYNIIGENEVEITQNEAYKVSGEVILPGTVNYDGVTYNVTCIGKYAFDNCKEITFVSVPEGVTAIRYFAFAGCSSLEYVELPNSLTTIEQHGFYCCTSMKEFHIPRNLTNIAYNVFNSFANLLYYTCSPLNPRYRAVDGLLYSKDMTELVAYPAANPATSFDIPTYVTRLGDYCLHNCDNLTEINIHENVTEMGMNIFSGCDNIESIYIPDAVTCMGVTVFGDCKKLSQVHLPASADSLLSSFFTNCPSLTEVTIPRNIRYIGTFAFADCKNLKTINFEEGSRLNKIDLRAFEKCYALEEFIMPDSVTVLGGQILGYCNGLKNVHLSDNLKILAGATFWYCTGLTELDIPGTVTFIGNAAITGCTSLKRIKVGDKNSTPNITFIEDCALDCANIERIELGVNIDSIDSYGLDMSQNLKVLISWSTTPPKTGSYGFYPYDAVLYVPKASVEAYRTAPKWNTFKTILPIEDVGDIDGNGSIGISDVTRLIDMILNGGDSNPLADVDLNGYINISDITELIDKVLNGN